jgi:hypothetical protein
VFINDVNIHKKKLVGTLTPYPNGFSKVKGNQFEAKSEQILFWLEEH